MKNVITLACLLLSFPFACVACVSVAAMLLLEQASEQIEGLQL